MKKGENIRLSKAQEQRIINLYSSDRPRQSIQEQLGDELNISCRSVRSLASALGLAGVTKALKNDKVLIYDIETSRVPAKIWSTGKQFVNYKQLKGFTKIISIAWKWLGSDKVHSVVWDKNHSDKELLEVFLKEYNSASMIVGQNNNSFDNKLIKARGAYHGLRVKRLIVSFDIYRHAKKEFRLHSYSMAHMAEYFGLTLKQSHEGLHMWDMIEDGTPKQQKEYLKKMVDYNKGDIVTTEQLYVKLSPYFGVVGNMAVKKGLPKWGCPACGCLQVVHQGDRFTPMGTIRRQMYCHDSKTEYEISNRIYMKYLQKDIDNMFK